MPLEALKTLLESDMLAVNQLISERLHSPVPLVNTIGDHIVNSGGKRIRPMLAILSARAFGCQDDKPLELAAIIEFIHTATLLHDDVVDGSLLRRGLDTANAIWGNEASVLVGDFLYSRSFQMMVSLQNMRVMDILANTTNSISEGEVLQLMYVHDPDITEQQYFEVIQRKTGELFCAATQLGAVIAERNEAEINALADYGMHLGLAYQLIDDVLDYSADAATLGKNIGDDLAEGKTTLPLIYALKHGNTAQQTFIRQAILASSIDNLPAIQVAIQSTHALEYVRKLAEEKSAQAINSLAGLPASPYKAALISLAEFAVQRKS